MFYAPPASTSDNVAYIEALGAEAGPEPKYLTLWPKEKSYFDDAATIKDEFKFGIRQFENLSLLLAFITADATIPLMNAATVLDPEWNITRTSGKPKPILPANEALPILRQAAANLGELLTTYAPLMRDVMVALVNAAALGLTKTGEAFEQIAGELSYWKGQSQGAGTVPPSIVNATIQFSQDWSDVAFDAGARFKRAKDVARDVFDLLNQIGAQERAVRIKAQDTAQAEIDRLKNELKLAQDKNAELNDFARAFDGFVERGRKRAQDLVRELSNLAPKVGSYVKWLVVGGVAVAVTAAIGAVVYYIPRKRS